MVQLPQALRKVAAADGAAALATLRREAFAMTEKALAGGFEELLVRLDQAYRRHPCKSRIGSTNLTRGSRLSGGRLLRFRHG